MSDCLRLSAQRTDFLQGFPFTFPKAPCTHIVYTYVLKYLYRDLFKAQVSTIKAHGAFGFRVRAEVSLKGSRKFLLQAQWNVFRTPCNPTKVCTSTRMTYVHTYVHIHTYMLHAYRQRDTQTNIHTSIGMYMHMRIYSFCSYKCAERSSERERELQREPATDLKP